LPDDDVATVKRTWGLVSSPTIRVGHSYGGSVITNAGTDDRVAGLVYIAALAPDAGETSQSQQDKFPVTDVFKYVEVADGRVWMRREGRRGYSPDRRDNGRTAYRDETAHRLAEHRHQSRRPSALQSSLSPNS
jgi:pimeloyl-ACP methyl ester carboxylesterase